MHHLFDFHSNVYLTAIGMPAPDGKPHFANPDFPETPKLEESGPGLMERLGRAWRAASGFLRIRDVDAARPFPSGSWPGMH